MLLCGSDGSQKSCGRFVSLSFHHVIKHFVDEHGFLNLGPVMELEAAIVKGKPALVRLGDSKHLCRRKCPLLNSSNMVANNTVPVNQYNIAVIRRMRLVSSKSILFPPPWTGTLLQTVETLKKLNTLHQAFESEVAILAWIQSMPVSAHSLFDILGFHTVGLTVNVGHAHLSHRDLQSIPCQTLVERRSQTITCFRGRFAVGVGELEGLSKPESSSVGSMIQRR
ncbi:hypothetical protein Tco_0697284 [Tanacetum coccineum]